MRSVSDVFAASSVTATQGIVDSVSDFLKATLHDKYLGSIADLVGQIDFDAVAVAAVDATERFRRAFPEEVQVRLGDVAEALDEADLGVVREAVEIAVSEAIERAAEEGVFAGRPVMWFMLNTLVAILVTLLQPWLVQLVEQKSIGESGKHETSRIASDVRLADDLVVVTASSLFLRVGPHTTQRILGTLHYGQVVRVLRRSSGWLRVSYVEAVDGQMRSGWVKGKYTSPLTTEAARMIWCAVCVHP
jgi:hypothetical protein